MELSQQEHHDSESKFLKEFRDFNVLHKVRNGYYLAEPGERYGLSRVIHSGEHEIKKYDVEIAKLKKQILSLERERKDVEECLSYSRSLLSPIRKLPREVLTRIFMHIMHDRYIYEAWGVSVSWKRPNFALSRASHTCAQWRSIIHTTRNFWNEMAIHTKDFEKGGGERMTTFLDWVLDKSGASPLHVEIISKDSWEEYGSDEPIQVSRLADVGKDYILCRLLPGLESLKMQLDFQKSSDFECFKDNLPSLKRLTLEIQNLPTKKSVTMFKDAPLLEHLSIEWYWRRVQPIPDLPWRQLKSLTLCPIPVTFIYSLLSQCHDILSLDVKLRFSNECQAPTQQIFCNHLRYFALRVSGIGNDWKPADVINLIQQTTFPSLEELVIEVSDFYKEVNRTTQIFETLQKQYSSSLSSLTIKAERSSLKYIVPIITSFHRLTSLTLDFSQCAVPLNVLFEDLTVPSSASLLRQYSTVQREFLPGLKNIYIRSNWKEVDQNALLGMVRSRSGDVSLQDHHQKLPTVTSLNSARFEIPLPLEEGIEEELKCLQLAGVDVSIANLW